MFYKNQQGTITKVIDGAKNNPESALIVKDTDEGTIILVYYYNDYQNRHKRTRTFKNM